VGFCSFWFLGILVLFFIKNIPVSLSGRMVWMGIIIWQRSYIEWGNTDWKFCTRFNRVQAFLCLGRIWHDCRLTILTDFCLLEYAIYTFSWGRWHSLVYKLMIKGPTSANLFRKVENLHVSSVHGIRDPIVPVSFPSLFSHIIIVFLSLIRYEYILFGCSIALTPKWINR